jgi:hypothetical protein
MPGEEEYLAHQRYMLETGQWRIGSGGPASNPLDGSIEYPSVREGFENSAQSGLSSQPISAMLQNQQRMEMLQASIFNLADWSDTRFLDSSTIVNEVIAVSNEFRPVINDFLKHAPENRLIAVWLYKVRGHVLLLDRSPREAAAHRFHNAYGLARLRYKRRYRAAVKLMKAEARRTYAYKIDTRDQTVDADTGRLSGPTWPFYILEDGREWAQQYDAAMIQSAHDMATRCVKWLGAK